MDSVKALMAGLIDYAGLFPPAALGMREAVRNYAGYLSGPDSASLGAFIVPIERLDELASELAALGPVTSAASRWKVSVIVKANAAEAIERVSRINASASGYRVSAIELGAGVHAELKAHPKFDAE